MSNSRGRPKGPEKQKTTVYLSPKMDRAVNILVAFRGGKNYSCSIEMAVLELAKQTVKQEGLTDKYPDFS